jgi:D-3-phosphoglycerate dehydrogenase
MVLLYEAMHVEGTKLLEEKCDVIYAKFFEEAHLISLVGDVDAIVIRANGAVSRAVIDSAGKLKVIGRHGAGSTA